MEPKVLILDEPTAGLDPHSRDEILMQIKKLHDEYKVIIIIVSHSMEDVAKLASRIIVMNNGKCVLDGTPEYVFSKADKLESIGLAVPQVTYLAIELKKRGINIPQNIYTLEQAKAEILKLLRGAGK